MSTERPGACDRAVSGAATASLTNDQKAAICILAAEAWGRAGRPYYDDQPSDLPECLRITKAEALDLWRHEEQMKACGKRHLTACMQDDYLALRAHFRALTGRMRGAARDAIEHEVGDRGLALKKLEKECALALDSIERPWDYVCGISRRKYKALPHDLGRKQIWSLIITLRSRAAKRRRAA